MILNRFYSMKRFQKICSSVIFQQKSDFFANYEHKMSDCVSIFFRKRVNFVFIGFFGQFYTNLRVKYFILETKDHSRHTLMWMSFLALTLFEMLVFFNLLVK